MIVTYDHQNIFIIQATDLAYAHSLYRQWFRLCSAYIRPHVTPSIFGLHSWPICAMSLLRPYVRTHVMALL
jgi:hypothetical protein